MYDPQPYTSPIHVDINHGLDDKIMKDSSLRAFDSGPVWTFPVLNPSGVPGPPGPPNGSSPRPGEARSSAPRVSQVQRQVDEAGPRLRRTPFSTSKAPGSMRNTGGTMLKASFLAYQRKVHEAFRTGELWGFVGLLHLGPSFGAGFRWF